MKRRNLLAALGALSAGGAIVTGSGAFTSVEAKRDLSVQVASDANALLRIDDKENGNAGYITDDSDDGEFGIDLTGSNSNLGGNGVNTNAITVIADLFEIQNQGTQPVDVEVTPLTFVDTNGGNTMLVLVVPDTNFPAVNLGVGDAETYHLIVDVFPGGTDVGVDDTITITAEA